MSTFIPDGYRAFAEVARQLDETEQSVLRQRIYDRTIKSVILYDRSGELIATRSNWAGQNAAWSRALASGRGKGVTRDPTGYGDTSVEGMILLRAKDVGSALEARAVTDASPDSNGKPKRLLPCEAQCPAERFLVVGAGGHRRVFRWITDAETVRQAFHYRILVGLEEER